MNLKKLHFWLLGLALATFGCSPDSPENLTEIPLTPTSECVQLTLYGGCGHNAATDDSEMSRAAWNDAKGEGSMTLTWEKDDKMSLILSDGEKPIVGRMLPQEDAPSVEVSHSELLVTPYEDDAHHAEFQSVHYYDAEALKDAKYCYVVSEGAEVSEDTQSGEHLCRFEMPASFTQTASQDSERLRDNIHMYATATYKEGRTNLNFNHIPALFRFVVTNTKSEATSLRELSITTSDNALVASKSATLAFDWSDGGAELSFDKSGYDRVTVAMANGGEVAAGEDYVAYAMVLPLSKSDALKNKALCFCIKYDNEEQIALQIDSEKLARLNGGDIYNWVGGKSYTIRITIREDGKATGEIDAENRIVLTPQTSGIYTLYYEGESGEPLKDYAEVCTLTAKEIAYYEDFIDVNIAPRAAKVIGIYNSAGERQGSIPLSTFKPDFAKEPLYSFGLLSDVHIGRAELNAETDFEKALSHFNAKGVAHTCICGDITQNGKEAELQSWQSVAALADAPIYTVTGNHDATSAGITPDLWARYTGLPLVFERTVERNGVVDHFLFLGMERWNFSSAYLDYHLSWLESKLEAYRNERCFVITHLFFPDRAGNLNGIYPSGNWLKGAQLEKLEAMCDNYRNSIWFSGHSHWEWHLQKYQDRANIHRAYNAALQPTSGWCVHVPSCGAPITSNGSSREDNVKGSEGAVVEVYEDHIDILGIDFISGKYLPIATYRLDTSLQRVEATTATIESYYLTAADFTVNPKKVGATVKDIEGDYVEITFTAKSQGFYVSNSTFIDTATKASITIEDVQAYSNGAAVEIPAGVGFYGSSGYYLVSTNKAEVKPASYTGVQFQTSGSKYGDGPLPLTLKMKCQMKFYE